MNYKKLIQLIIRSFVISAVVTLMTCAAVRLIYADDGHISAESTDGEIAVGDTFSIELSTSEMTVSTFTGYVRYDDSMVEYVSYSGTDGKNVSLSAKNGSSVSLIVGANEKSPYFGFGFAGAGDAEYEECNGFITLRFRALAEGIPTFVIGEDSDGKDGVYHEIEYSPDIIIADDGLEREEKEVVELIITEAPDKTEYNSGDSFDASGMTVTAKYSDGTSEIVDDYVIYDKTLSSDDTDIMISYRGAAARQQISVGELEPEGISGVSEAEETEKSPVPVSAQNDIKSDEKTWLTSGAVTGICVAAVLIMIIIVLSVIFLRKKQNDKT